MLFPTKMQTVAVSTPLTAFAKELVLPELVAFKKVARMFLRRNSVLGFNAAPTNITRAVIFSAVAVALTFVRAVIASTSCRIVQIILYSVKEVGSSESLERNE